MNTRTRFVLLALLAALTQASATTGSALRVDGGVVKSTF